MKGIVNSTPEASGAKPQPGPDETGNTPVEPDGNVTEPDVCQKSNPERTPGPNRLLAPVASEWERRALDGGNGGRCHTLWTLLYGRSCDFDDCWIELAELLETRRLELENDKDAGGDRTVENNDGPYNSKPHNATPHNSKPIDWNNHDLSGVLNKAGDIISSYDWITVAPLAQAAYTSQRGTKPRYNPETNLDWRTWDELTDDSQFSGTDGQCGGCELGIGGTAEEHRQIAKNLISRNRTWDYARKQIAKMVADQTTEKTLEHNKTTINDLLTPGP